MVKKLLLCVVLVCLFTSVVFGQQNLSVPLGDPVYSIIEHIELRNYVTKLHTARPYTLNLIIDTLYEALDHPDMSLQEKDIILNTIQRLNPPETTKFDEDASVWRNIGEFGKTGTYRYEETGVEFPVAVEAGTSLTTSIASNFNIPNFSHQTFLNVYLKGDVSDYFSYTINADLGIMKLDYDAYKPFSFSPNWAGYLYEMSSLSAGFEGKTEEFAAGINLLPELGLSFWDNKIGFNFSRVRRDWGTGNGNLLLSRNAQPFVGLEMYLRPVDFISLSTITGVLEYYVDSDAGEEYKGNSATFQNAYSAFMGEVFFGDYAYLGINSTVIWPKRFELGYIFPLMIPFFYQNMIGDYDNMLMGGSLGINIPKYGNLYFNLFMDELNLLSDDFFHKDRNMYTYQAGMKIAIPNTPFVTLNFQYTKVEPYMYTHPGASHPIYDNGSGDNRLMETSYVNHGENLGYYLRPNSDELKITATSLPFWYLKTNLSYSLVRHGAEYGTGKVDGSNPNDHNYYYGKDEDDYSGEQKHFTKYFLKDGVYEWTHSLGMNAELDLRFVKDIPLSFNMGYTLAYTHYTTPNVLHESFKPINNSEYKNAWSNYFTLSVKVW